MAYRACKLTPFLSFCHCQWHLVSTNRATAHGRTSSLYVCDGHTEERESSTSACSDMMKNRGRKSTTLSNRLHRPYSRNVTERKWKCILRVFAYKFRAMLIEMHSNKFNILFKLTVEVSMDCDRGNSSFILYNIY